MLAHERPGAEHELDQVIEEFTVIFVNSSPYKLLSLEKLGEVACSLEQLVEVDAFLPFLLQAKRMHGCQNDSLVEEYLVQWISVVCQHDVILIVTIYELGFKDACFLFKVGT